MSSSKAKKGKTHRIDAAIAALTPLGFKKMPIRNTVKKLLKVYGDNDSGWYFVEEDYYKLVIENMIESQEEEMKQQAEGEAETKAPVEATTAETSQQTLLQLEAGSSKNTDTPRVVKPLISEKAPLESSPPVRRPCYGWISEDDDDEEEEKPRMVKPLSGKAPLESVGVCGTSSSPPVRKPCYGWISEEED